MKMHKGRGSVLVLAALLAVGAQQAFAQPGGVGPMAMRGAGAHGHGFAIEEAIASMKAQLNLDTSQQLMWDNAAAQRKAAREVGRASREQVRATMAAELAKAEPDLAALAAAADAARAEGQALRKKVRDAWLQMYATLSPAQKGVIRDALVAKMARAEQFRGRMQERMQQRRDGGG